MELSGAGAGAEKPARDGHDVAFAYQTLRASILHGEIPAGTVMSQVNLAKRLGLSRTPLREAVRFLQHEGLIDVEPNRRLRVATLTVEDVEQLYVMRVALESTAVHMTVPDFQPVDIAEMKGLIAQMEHFAGERDFLEFERPHRAFHALLVAGGGERLGRAISELSDHAERYRRAYMGSSPSAYAVTMDEHREMLDAAAAQDAPRTVERLVAQYARTASTVIEALDPGFSATRLRLAVAQVTAEPVA